MTTAALAQFDHIREGFRAKVAVDFLSFIRPDGSWDIEKCDPLNDYQRHLYALFLRLAGIKREMVHRAICVMAVDVLEVKRSYYADMVCQSEIVGFPTDALEINALPVQAIAR